MPDDTSTGDSLASDGPNSCHGVVPVQCLGIDGDPNSCPGEVGSCAWHACAFDRATHANIDWLACLARECDFKPVHDIECLELWADLALECFETECEPSAPQACSFVYRGAQHDCHDR